MRQKILTGALLFYGIKVNRSCRENISPFARFLKKKCTTNALCCGFDFTFRVQVFSDLDISKHFVLKQFSKLCIMVTE